MGSSPLDLGEIGDLVHHRTDARQQAQPIFPQSLVLYINGHFVEKFINRSAKRRQSAHRGVKLLVTKIGVQRGAHVDEKPMQLVFLILLEALGIDWVVVESTIATFF